MVPQFIDFLKNNVLINCSLSEENFKNLRLFFFSSNGKYFEEKYIQILNKFTEWKKIEKKVLELVKTKNNINM